MRDFNLKTTLLLGGGGTPVTSDKTVTTSLKFTKHQVTCPLGNFK
jgi:hypothetical protein